MAPPDQPDRRELLELLDRLVLLGGVGQLALQALLGTSVQPATQELQD